MTWVKVCGLTNAADVAATIDAGADAIGFVHIPESPRYVSLDQAAQLAQGVPCHSILLTVDLEPAAVLEILATTDLDGVQPYGSRAAAVARSAVQAGYVALTPQPAASGIDIASIPGIPLIDTPSAATRGGTGVAFDWNMVADLGGRFVLAGGLGPENIVDAVATTGAWGVDASSGLEQAPGQKDPARVAAFIAKAKNQ
ncbi:MAG: phosphoribosylanthranilate isomerase [Acidimicrobiia bacterium]|nr:phosphoribosylanthranilate isomerase [Acidimicrobiia bacterium]